jgi:hypothetical protein
VRTTYLGLSLALLALLGGGPSFAAASSCLDCHGSVEKMKALVAPPVAGSTEGEG